MFCTFSLPNARIATAACNVWTSELQKSYINSFWFQFCGVWFQISPTHPLKAAAPSEGVQVFGTMGQKATGPSEAVQVFGEGETGSAGCWGRREMQVAGGDGKAAAPCIESGLKLHPLHL